MKDQEKPRRNEREGSALVLTLMVVSLLLVVVMAFSVHVRMELRQAGQQQAQALARANARLGLQLAVARLQETAGPDQRVTFRREVMDTDPTTEAVEGVAQTAWCGVVVSPERDSDYDLDQGAGLRAPALAANAWLVSGWELPGFDPDLFSPVLSGAARNAVRLRETSGLATVDVPRMSADAGAYGYWVDDEGVKARMDLPPNEGSLEGAETVRYLAPATLGAEQALVAAQRATFPSNDANTLGKLVSEETLDFLADPAWQADGTLWSRGVLADVKKGGLKTDLTAAFENSAAWGQVSQFKTLLLREIPGVVADDYADRLQDQSAGLLWRVHADFPATAGLRWYSLFHYYNLYKSQMAVIPSRTLIANPLPLPPVGLGGKGGGSADPCWTMVDGITIGALMPVPLGFKAELALSSYQINNGDDGINGNADDEFGLRLHYIPSLVLWNPFDVELREPLVNGRPVGYMFGGSLYKVNAATMSVRLSTSSWTEDVEVLPRAMDGSGNFVPVDTFSFRLRDGEKRFEPGEIRVFGLERDDPLPNDFLIPKLTRNFNEGASVYRNLPLSNPLTRTQVLTVAFQERVIAANANYHVEAANGYPYRAGSPYSFGVPNPQNRFEGFGGEAGMEGSATYVTVLNIQPPQIEGIGSLQRFFAYMSRVKGRAPEESTLRVPTQGGPGSFFNTVVLSNSLRFWDDLHRTGTGFLANEEFQNDGDGRSFWGEPDVGVPGGLHARVQYELPRAPLVSLGQFRHLRAPFPASMVPVGNSWPSPELPLTSLFERGGVGIFADNVQDDNWLNNDALFDGYFFSTVPPDSRDGGTVYPGEWGRFPADFTQTEVDAGEPLLNPRITYFRDSENAGPPISELRNLDQAAAHLMVEGGFNVNSTSVPAWRALLASLRFPDEPAGGVPTPRFVQTLAARPMIEDVEAGERVLSDDQVEALAVAIVEQVKQRGPFLSLSDFINRRLENSELGRKGALQAAIDASGINTAARSDLGAENVVIPSPFPQGHWNSFTLSRQSNLRSLAAADNYDTAMGTPGLITQADLLQYLAPVLTARSDTFRIRVAGEAGDAANPSSIAWMEAVVQRVPDYVDEADEPWERDADLSAVNTRFGRKFRVVSLRWLNGESL